MVSRLRIKLDLLLQGILLVILALATTLEPWRTAVIVALLILSAIQITSAAQLWIWHRYRPAKTYLFVFLAVAVLLPFGLHFFSSLAWLCLIFLAIAYFWHTVYMANVVLRRPRSFWDLT